MALTDFLSGIADAIRYAEGSTGEINAQKFAERIRALSGSQPVSPILSSITATKTKTEYTVNDTLNIDDITVTANYSDGSSSVVSGWTSNVSDVDMASEGAKTLTISYTENEITKTASININVNTVTPEPSVDVIEVGKEDTYTYHTIKDAEAAVSDGGTIRIHEGEYEEYAIGTVNKSITYEGVNKDTCIVFNGLSDKMYSVFDLANGNKTVKNLTIHQTHANPQNPDTGTVAYKAYSVHCDSESNEGHQYLIENCILRNKYFCCCGFGLWQDHTITVKDCSLDLYDSNRDITSNGAYYCHCDTYANNVTGQRISLINNTIHAYQSKAIRIDVAKQDGSEMICEFINNTCSSDLYGSTNDCVTFSTNDHTTLTETSAGNNVAILNYETPASYTAPDGLKDTGYWFVAYDKTADKYYAVNSVAKITNAYKHSSTLSLMMTIDNGNAKNNGWTSDDGVTWTQTITDYIEYKTFVRLRSLNSSMYNNIINLVEAWSSTEFSWDY